jgi:hypothetical protein
VRIEQELGWTSHARARVRSNDGSAALARAATAIRTRVRVRPMEWLAAYPLVAPVVLLAVAGLMYMLQVNQTDNLNFTLSQLQTEQSLSSSKYANDVAQLDKRTSCERICTIAATRLNMVHADLTRSIWLTVRLPAAAPHLARMQPIPTGPLPWLESAAQAVRDSL